MYAQQLKPHPPCRLSGAAGCDPELASRRAQIWFPAGTSRSARAMAGARPSCTADMADLHDPPSLRPVPAALSAAASRAGRGRRRRRAAACPVSCTPPISRSGGVTGSRNASSQYRAYERMACLDSARSSPPGAWLPITRRRLPSSTCTPGPWRRQARSAANLNPRWAHDSGRRHTTDQPRPYPASVSLSLSLGTGHLLKRTPGRPVRLQDRLSTGNSRSRAIAEFPAPALLRANPRQGQVPVAGGPRRSRVRDRRPPREGLLSRCPGGVTRRWSGAHRSRRRPPCCRSRRAARRAPRRAWARPRT